MVSYIFSADFPTVFKNHESRIVNGFDTGGPIPYQLSLTFSLGQFLTNNGVEDVPNLTDLQAESADSTYNYNFNLK